MHYNKLQQYDSLLNSQFTHTGYCKQHYFFNHRLGGMEKPWGRFLKAIPFTFSDCEGQCFSCSTSYDCCDLLHKAYKNMG